MELGDQHGFHNLSENVTDIQPFGNFSHGNHTNEEGGGLDTSAVELGIGITGALILVGCSLSFAIAKLKTIMRKVRGSKQVQITNPRRNEDMRSDVPARRPQTTHRNKVFQNDPDDSQVSQAVDTPISRRPPGEVPSQPDTESGGTNVMVEPAVSQAEMEVSPEDSVSQRPHNDNNDGSGAVGGELTGADNQIVNKLFETSQFILNTSGDMLLSNPEKDPPKPK